MKYQKSMLKILQYLLTLQGKEAFIEDILKNTGSGRASGYEALNWMESVGLLEIRNAGRQRNVKIVLDNYALQYKYYLDAFRFKALDSSVKLILGAFISLIKDAKEIEKIVLFGSVLDGDKFNDIDLMVIGNVDREYLSEKREIVERVFGVTINIHYECKKDSIFRGAVIYQNSYIDISNEIKNQYLEYVEWLYIFIKSSRKNKEAFERAVLNLAFCHSLLEGKTETTKKGVLEVFRNEYSINSLESLKKAGEKIGKKIFK